jgi:hypothetical protein
MKKQLDRKSLAVAIGALLIQIPFLVTDIDWYSHSATTEGVVTRLNSGGHKLQIEFTANDGKRISTPASSIARSLEAGERIVVRYDIRSPRIAKIDGVLNLWDGYIFLTAMSLFAFWKAIAPEKPAELK